MTGPASAPATPAEATTALFDMMLAYKTTALLRTAVELTVFDALADAPQSATEMAARLGIAERGARVLLNALAALGLVAYDGHTFKLTDLAASHLVSGRRGYLGGMSRVLASRWEWDAMGALTEAVRAGGPVVLDHAETPRYSYWEDFAAFAGAVAQPVAGSVADRLRPWAAGRDRLHVLDVACGHGLYGYVLAQTFPNARVWSLDWPNVLPIAHQHATELGVVDRTAQIAGDMFEVPLGGPYDVVMVTNVLHHFSPQRATMLLRRVADVLDEDGRLVVVGFVTRDGPPSEDPASHLFSVLMLVWTLAGEAHTEATYRQMFDAVGFDEPAVWRPPSLPLAIITAGKRPARSQAWD